MVQPTKLSVWRREFVLEALRNAGRKLHPKTQWHNPVMFCVEIGATLITLLTIARLLQGSIHGLFRKYCRSSRRDPGEGSVGLAEKPP